VLALFSNMLGAALLSIPLMFRDAGLLSSTVVLALAALVSFITCRIYALHSTEEDEDVEATIRRILGPKWERSFRFVTGCYLIFLSIITLDLIVDQLFSIIYSLCKMAGSVEGLAKKSEFSFGSFSTQWLSLLMFLPLMRVVSLKNVTFLVKLSEYGSATIFIYALYVVAQFFAAALQGEVYLDNVTWISWGSLGKAGTCILAFTVHPIVVTILKQNRHQGNNQRDLATTFGLAFALYELVAVLGALAVSGKECSNTIVDCYLHDWTILVVSVSYLFGGVTILPVSLEVGRTRVLELFSPSISERQFRRFNWGFMVVATITSILSPYMSVSWMMNLVGALVCYLFIYLVPTKLHYACLYPSRPAKDEKEMELIDDLSTQSSLTSCTHDCNYAQKRPPYQRKLLYGAINVVGVTIAIGGFYSSVRDIL
jgi:amino acid permease